MTEFQLDLQDQRLLNGGQPVQLTSRAFQLLRLFVDNPNRLLTKADILDSVWRDVFVSEGLVKEYVHDLRLALGDDARQPRFIETVHGRGYRFLGGVKALSRVDGVATPTSLRSRPPRLAVLPFTNLTGEPRWDRFSHGLGDDLVIDMSRYPDLVVIASMGPSKGLANGDLTTDYALSGSVQLSGDQVRVNVKLIETGSGALLWTEQYERELGEFFAIQSDIVGHVVSAVGGFGGQIPHAERLRLGRAAPDDFRAYELYLQGHELEARFEKDSTLRAFALMQRAVRLEPDFARAWIVRGWACWQIILEDWATDAQDYHELWRESFLRAAELDPLDPIAMMELAAVRAADQDITGAGDALERALDLGRYQADLLISSANPIALILDDPRRAKATMDRGLELIAVPGDWHRLSMSRVAYFTGDFESALDNARRGPDNLLSQLMEILSLAQLGAGEDLAAQRHAFRARHSRFDPEAFVRRYPITANGARELFFDGIGKAGLN